MTLFIKRFFKMMDKQKFFIGDKKDKLRTRGHATIVVSMVIILPIVPMSVGMKKKKKEEEEEESYKRDKNCKKKSYGEAHIGKKWDSNDEFFDSDSDGGATVAIKGSSSSLSKSLFPNLNNGKHTYLMAKENRRKVKSNTSLAKYVSSDDALDSSDDEDDDEEALLKDMSKNPKARIKGLLSQVGLRDEFLEQQEKLLVQEKESNQELKKLLKLEKEKMENLDLKLAQSNETISSLKSSSGAIQDSDDVLQKIHKVLEVQFDALWSSTSKPSNNNEASTSQVSVETCDETIAQENDHLKIEVNRLEQMVSELVKQAKV
jgi:hypothetical protein